ncbi:MULTISPECIES: DUF779 domain-containing protein [Dietzia]|jgi:uncharacterized protein (DUF779 family)|uniref:DUF779 domain-containing protein n=2 Tax=Dietzia maris TaxID=37915 RepID=A0AAE4QWF0_9ACTN|nr:MULTISPECIES: DUF779 domain-containing protein [Dietzia]MCT1520963.1 DUF779 domain-containing protein [Dietzia maris]MCZ4539961.1 DUF779 domain-containing protein [Dietzia maris]MCZ4654401.1 DUF779 domain-containing protein [Dietzia kunjamensis]MDN4505199.1 DUF779 domain-containing protein [Dietzia maris]MDV3356756.1 DUF779 domain-containing protein [Dietzia sp. IN118]
MDDVCGLPSGGSVRIAARALPPEGAPADLPPRLVATEPAVELIRELVGRHGPVMFHQSGGCCDGSAPMCYPDGEFRVGQRDVLVGELDLAPGVRVWISGSQFETWKHTQLVLDAIPGRGSGFSLENPTGKRFLSRARTFDTAELAALEEFPPRLGSELEE